MSNIVKFQKSGKSLPIAQGAQNVAGEKAIPRTGPTLKTVLSWTWVVVRYPIFLVLYWLRMPVVLVCNLISIPALIAWLFAWYAFPEKPAMVWGFAVISLICFVIAWSYDFVLMLLSPQPMIKSL